MKHDETAGQCGPPFFSPVKPCERWRFRRIEQIEKCAICEGLEILLNSHSELHRASKRDIMYAREARVFETQLKRFEKMKNSAVAVKQTKSAPVGVITPELLKDLSIRFGAALNEIVKPMGMVIAMDGSRYGKSHANMKMRLLVTVAGEKSATKPFERECRELGINPDLIGTKFTSARFGECTFVGVNLNRPKMVLDVLTADGKPVRGPVGMIKAIIDNEVKAAKKVSAKKAAMVEDDDDLNLDDEAPAATGKRAKRTAKTVNNMTDAEMLAALSDDDETPKVRSRRSAKKPAAKKPVSAKGKAFAAKMKAAREAAQAKRSGKKVAAKPARSARSERAAAPKLTRAERQAKAERAIKRLERQAAKRAAERKANRSAKRTTTRKPAAKVARKTTRSAKPAARKSTKRRSRMA